MKKKNLCIRMMKALAFGIILMVGRENFLSYAAGWQQDGGNWHYYNDNDQLLVSSMTPDGYYIDETGNWKQYSIQILDLKIEVPNRYCTPEEQADWSSVLKELNQIKNKVYAALGEKRKFHVYEDAIIYSRVVDKTEYELLSLHKNTQNHGYELRISADLGKRTDKRTLASTYDYEVFRFLLAKITHYPVQAADAIYQSWQGENTWGINREQDTQVMDMKIKCGVENGKGIYKLCPLTQ